MNDIKNLIENYENTLVKELEAKNNLDHVNIVDNTDKSSIFCCFANNKIGTFDQKMSKNSSNTKNGYLNKIFQYFQSLGYLKHVKNLKITCATNDNTIRVLNVKNKCIKTYQGHSAYLTCLTTIDENTIASGSSDNTIRLWEISSGNCFQTFTGHTGYIMSIAKLDENKLISAGYDDRIKVWDISRGVCLKSFELGVGKNICCLTVLDKNLVLYAGNGIYVRNVNRSGDHLEINENLVKCYAVMSRDKIIFANYLISFYKVNNNGRVTKFREFKGHERPILCLAILNESLLVSGSEDKTIKVWNMDSGTCENTLVGHVDSVTCLAKIDENTIISASRDETIKMWNIHSGYCFKTLEIKSPVLSMMLLKENI